MGRAKTWFRKITVQEHCVRAITRKENKDKQSKYNATLWRVGAAIVTVEKQ